MCKKAIAGVSNLIIFLAVLIIATITTGILLSTTSSLQQQSISTTEHARKEVSNTIFVNKVIGQDGTNGNIEILCEQIKLGHGSDPIRWNDVTIHLGTDNNDRDYIQGAKVPRTLEVGGGFQTIPHDLFDLDGDGADDSIRLIPSYIIDNDEHLEIRASGNALEFIRLDLGEDLAAAGTTPVNMQIYGQQFTETGSDTGATYTIQLSVVGVVNQDETIPNTVHIALSSLPNIPQNAGVYSITEKHNPNGENQDLFTKNEIAEVCFGTESLTSDISVRISHIFKYGIPYTINFIMPDLIITQREMLYPYYEG